VDAYVDRHPIRHVQLRGATSQFTLRLPSKQHAGRVLTLEGYRNDRLVAATRVRLQ
jgi:hypothetical protein